jgi:AcrR family transcriptional regulator
MDVSYTRLGNADVIAATDHRAKERLLKAAGQIFAEKGFKAATIKEITESAGVNIAAVNYYFSSKERLYIESVKHAHSGMIEGMRKAPWPPGTPTSQKLRDFIGGFVARLFDPTRPAWLVQLMMREMMQPTEACVELVRDNIRPVAEGLMAILREILPPDTPRWKLLMAGQSIISQCVFYCQNRPIIEQLAGPDYQFYSPAAITEHITRFSLAALGLEKPLSQGETKT